MKYDTALCRLVEKKEIAKGFFDFRVQNTDLMNNALPGQFVHILVPGKTLRRPISICDVENGCMRLVFEIRGEGTDILSQMKVGDDLDILGPLGTGFKIEKGKKYAFVGGGIGTPPLLYAAKQADTAIAVLGFRSSDAIILKEDFEKACSKVYLTTDDGSAGHHGFVTDPLSEIIGEVDEVCACGPTPMLKAIALIAQKNAKPCQISMEERMGCGVGACLVCACKTKINNVEGYSHVCKAGPVFRAEEVVF
ncbi:MAG: dihydroorotate dehydrogenase electron transfer subunit [Bacillota bacterium]|nr:dihydroorotate dehydrogenase electron transfer subunit [Bacillota bacterium]